MKCEKCGSDLTPLVSQLGHKSSEFYCRICNKSTPMSEEAWNFFQKTKTMKRVNNAPNR